ncbi:MAG: hypothetical protein PF569_07125 [Candidatus Woesearchaeota archaeon]|jgi:hypothetical protein|nr:hypothetical protein [Candidatus Woesearchaeota archaeon]
MFKKSAVTHSSFGTKKSKISSTDNFQLSCTIFSKTKKGISPVVAISLLLVVSVFAVVGFNNWYSSYSSNLLDDAQIKGDLDSMYSGINTLIDGNLYFNNPSSENLSILKVTVGGVDCNILENIESGLGEIDLSSCSEDLNGKYDVKVFTEDEIYTKTYNFDYDCHGYCTSLSFMIDLGKLSGEQVNFQINYTTDDFNFSGIGFTENYIGRVIWNTIDYGAYIMKILAVDLDEDGISDEVLVAKSGRMYAFNEDGSDLWDTGISGGYIYDFELFDYDNDGFKNDLIVPVVNGDVHILNKSGGIEQILDLTSDDTILVENCEFDGDGLNDEFTITNNSHVIGLDNDFSILWTEYYGAYGKEIECNDMDKDGFDELGIATYTGSTNYFFLINYTGDQIFNTTSLGNGLYSIAFVDWNKDGFDDVAFSGFEYIRYYDYLGNELYSNGAYSTESNLDKVNEMYKFDYANDGVFEILMGNTLYGGGPSYLSIYNGTEFIDYVEITSAEIDAISIEIGENIYVGLENGEVHSYDKELNFLWKYDLGDGDVGPVNIYGKGDGLDLSDINGDGQVDLLAVENQGVGYILQDVDCEIQFFDGTYDLDWNNSINQWQYNRTFALSGTYDYTVLCGKNSYQSQRKKGSVLIS